MTAPRRRRLKAVFEGRRDQLDRLRDTRIEDRDPRVFAVVVRKYVKARTNWRRFRGWI